MGRGPPVHPGPWWTGVVWTEGAAVMEEEDELVEAVLGRCSPVPGQWRRGGAPEAANGGGLSSSRG
jgi:hypothetical protein